MTAKCRQWRLTERGRAAVLGLCASLACQPLAAQIGPLDLGGYAEYRFDHIAGGNAGSPVAHRFAVRTDFATYVWRPWLLTASGGLNVVYGTSDTGAVSRESTSLGGNIRLNFLPRSKFPLAVYYIDTDDDTEAASIRTSGSTRQYGFTQQLHTKRLGRYSLDWQQGESSSLSDTSILVHHNRRYERAQLSVDKAVGAHRFGLSSRYFDLSANAPGSRTEALRHTLRHNFRSGTTFTWRNDAFLNDENQTNEIFWSDRRYYQFNSLVTWLPETRRRLLVTGRGLFQGSESLTPLSDFSQHATSASANASYYLTDRLTLTAGLGAARGSSDERGDTQSHFQQVSAAYRSAAVPALGGNYAWRANVAAANRLDDNDTERVERQIGVITLGHSFNKSLDVAALGPIQLKLSQDVGTNADTTGRKREQLRHSVHVTTGSRGDTIERFVRLSLTDQRTFGDERRTNQLVNLQLSLRGRPDNDRQWTGNMSVQYGRNRLQFPAEFAGDAESLGYSVNLDYRHANLWGVSNLDFNSEFRFLSSDLQTDDPLDLDIGFDSETRLSYWRNRLLYTIGLLRLQGIVTLREVDGDLVAGVTLTVRRYFGN